MKVYDWHLHFITRRSFIESNAEAIIKSCHSPNVVASDIEVIVEDCVFLKNALKFCSFTFVRRQCNRAAHDCAKKILSFDLSGLWPSNLSPTVLDYLMSRLLAIGINKIFFLLVKGEKKKRVLLTGT